MNTTRSTWLSDHLWAEQVELDLSGDVGDGWLAWLAGGEVAGFLGFAGAVAGGAVADGEAGGEDFQQERGEGELWLVRGGKPRRCPSRRPGRAGSLSATGGCPRRRHRFR